jgi:hypothetical protein
LSVSNDRFSVGNDRLNARHDRLFQSNINNNG